SLIDKEGAAAALQTGAPLMFGPKNNFIYFEGWTRNAAETMGLFRYNPKTDKKTLIYSNPTVDVMSVIPSFDHKSIVGVWVMPGKPEVVALNPKSPRIQLLAALSHAIQDAKVEI